MPAKRRRYAYACWLVSLNRLANSLTQTTIYSILFFNSCLSIFNCLYFITRKNLIMLSVRSHHRTCQNQGRHQSLVGHNHFCHNCDNHYNHLCENSQHSAYSSFGVAPQMILSCGVQTTNRKPSDRVKKLKKPIFINLKI